MDWWMVENRGEADPAGMRLMGASSKRGDASKIGFFGTGWKYATACLLRLGASIRVHSGEREVCISTREATLRGERFEEVLLDGQGTGITTAVGPQWTAWMAVRELICNAIDEGLVGNQVTAEEPRGAAGTTRVWVQMVPAVAEVMRDARKYFRLVPEEGEVRVPGGRLLPKADGDVRVYRKGVLVMTRKVESLWDYDVDHVDITEDRTASEWEARRACWRLVDASGAEQKVEFLRDGRAWERGLGEEWGAMPSEHWAEALAGTLVVTATEARVHREDLPQHIVIGDENLKALKRVPGVRTAERVLRGRCIPKGERDHRDPLRNMGEEGRVLRTALAGLAARGIVVAYEDVVLVDSFGGDHDCGVQGSWDPRDRKIRVLRSLRGFELTHTLIHEWAHRESGAPDSSRAFEGFLGRAMTALATTGRVGQ